MSNDIVVPDYLKALMADDTSVSSADLVSSASSVPRISLKGSKFRLIEGGEEVEVIKDQFPVIILGVEPRQGFAKTFYAKGYDPTSTEPPNCSSSDGIRPDSWVQSPVSPVCATCENNKWGSATALSGKKSKACRDSKRLYVVKPDQIEGGTIYIVNVTVSSLKNLSEYGKKLAQARMPMEVAITALGFDEQSDYPKLTFAYMGALNEKVGPKAIERASKREWETPQANQPAIEQKSAPALTQQTPAVENNEPTESADIDDLLNDW